GPYATLAEKLDSISSVSVFCFPEKNMSRLFIQNILGIDDIHFDAMTFAAATRYKILPSFLLCNEASRLTEIMTAFAPMEVGTVFEPAEASFDVEKLLAEASRRRSRRRSLDEKVSLLLPPLLPESSVIAGILDVAATRACCCGLGESGRLGGLKLGYRPENELIGFCEDCDDKPHSMAKLQQLVTHSRGNTAQEQTEEKAFQVKGDSSSKGIVESSDFRRNNRGGYGGRGRGRGRGEGRSESDERQNFLGTPFNGELQTSMATKDVDCGAKQKVLRLKFDDEYVTKEDMKRALDEKYGREKEWLHQITSDVIVSVQCNIFMIGTAAQA
ncbi:hypothetical protein Tco_0506283, partial [Tanacetum coccineum]